MKYLDMRSYRFALFYLITNVYRKILLFVTCLYCKNDVRQAKIGSTYIKHGMNNKRYIILYLMIGFGSEVPHHKVSN